MAIYIRRTTWIDFSGNVRTTTLTGNATMALIESALISVSNADEASESEAQIFVNPTPTPINADYKSVTDFAELWYLTVGGSIISITLPAPRTSVFMADQETVDPASVAGITTAVIGVLCTLGGDPAASFVAGIRRKGG